MALLNLCNTLPFPHTSIDPCISKQPKPEAFRSININTQVKCSLGAQVNVETEKERRSAHYQPTLWSYNFVQSLKVNDNAVEMFEDKARKLEHEIRFMIQKEDGELLTMLELIDDISRLGLAHSFEIEIHRALERFVSLGGCAALEDKSLHALALGFRLLRQHDYEVTQDIFEDYMDQNGDIKRNIKHDVKGILSLYEASFLAYEGEDLLQKATLQTKRHLNHLQRSRTNLDSKTAEFIGHALEMPLYRRMVLLEARWYIGAYSRKHNANQTLSELAKLHFNMVQSVLQNDLKDMSRWWKNLGLSNKLKFSRDRLMECLFWTVGMGFEPELSSCRQGLTKVTSFITTIDDVYDVHGTLEELELFTDAVERWEIDAVKNLPDYMKLCFLALYNTINEMAYETLKEQGEDVLLYLRKAWSDLCKAFLQEAKWSHDKCTPSFKEYSENAWKSVSGTVILVHAYFLLNQSISKQALDCLVNYHELIRWASVLFRLYNDLATSSDEVNRGETVNSITCYMQEMGVSEEQAREHIQRMIDQGWKEIIKRGQTVDGPFAEPFRRIAINLARISSCTYQHGDSHGAPDASSKNRIWSLIIEPIWTI